MEGGPNIQEKEDEPAAPRGCFNFLCHPLGSGHRFIALIFMCFLSFGSYFCYDNPAALQDKIKENLDLSEVQYTSLYSVYSWPNVVLNIIGGFLIDRVFGIRLGTIVYMSLTLLGQLIFATAVTTGQYWMMLIGRFVFGIGAESLTVAQNNYAVLWFKGKELNMVFGLQLSFARVGSTVNFLVMESLYSAVSKITSDGHHILGIVLYIAACTCIVSMICALVMAIFDKRSESILGRNNNPSGETVKLTDVKDFSLSFWLVCVICVTFYCAIFPFISIAKQFFEVRFGMTSEQANDISSIVYVISGVASPILGFLVDKTGMNVYWILLGVSGTTLAHVLLGFTSANPYLAIAIMGLAYSILASSLWPLVSLIIPEYQLGTSYGVAGSIQNLGLALFNIFCGLIIDKFGYTGVEIFFISSLIAAFISSVGLLLLDRIDNGILNKTPAARSRHHMIHGDTEKLVDPDAEATANSSDHHEPSDFDIRNSFRETSIPITRQKCTK
ncbi:lysosomal dipeptide transporter MFSD1 isoform X2 [Diabrotica undecimpunctata]|uniref:lysosomal dipeptide transporter MFSD1 isoform X2 n=1 Tax=Diabrotica undecimpunctata TaxID=50387 RepID=UPI003B637C5A